MSLPTNKISSKELTGFEVAIIGMEGIFPGAKNIDMFWENLCKGRESISFFTKEEMLREGVAEQLLNSQNYVNAGGMLEDYDKFDASFFKYSPREAELLNPQDRLFLEAAWGAFENAGYDILKYKMPVGVFVGLSEKQYPLFNEVNNSFLNNDNYWQEHMLGSSAFLPTRISFHFDLTGPSVAIQTACSSSLVAVHAACQSLLSGECTIALAGGVSVNEFQKTGYLHQKNMILSSDGHCRAFDNKADGTVIGNGLGIVILKRLEDAINDGDRIEAVIKGSAVNNDGGSKIGYTAPSADGHAKVVIDALKISNINAETISYVETHGTGTILGDPIEINALTRAFQHYTNKKNFCLIGSVKTNIGHLDNAAGVAGLIKTVLCLKYKIIPPSLHFESSNTSIDFKNIPFNVNSKLTPWDYGCLPRRAGISSLGIGGTNAHIILEEAQDSYAREGKRTTRIVCFSAKTQYSLDILMDSYSSFLMNCSSTNIDDLAYTLQVGRHHHENKAVIVCDTIIELRKILDKKTDDNLLTDKTRANLQKIVFMFPGQGTEYVNMGNYFYQSFPVYKNIIDQCADILLPIMKLDIRDILYPKGEVDSEKDPLLLKNTQITQISLFVVEYALAKLLISLNVCPDYMIGCGVGEYVAACLSDVFNLEDALYIICSSGELIQKQPDGDMLAVLASFETIKSFLDKQISLTAINGKNSYVVEGPKKAINDLQNLLNAKRISSINLRNFRALNSKMMLPILEKFTLELKKIKLNTPKIPTISNVSGNWVSLDEVTKLEYWGKHADYPGFFEKGLVTISQQETDLIFLEVGPGCVLTSFILNHEKRNLATSVLNVLPDAKQSNLSEKHFNLMLGKLWLAGIDINFLNYYQNEKRLRISLPTYQFERQSFWSKSVRNHTGNKDEIPSANLEDQNVTVANDLEHGISKIWEDVFGRTEISVHDNFFELGGNSLIAIQIIAQIKKALDIDLPLTTVLRQPTIHKVTQFIKTMFFNDIEEENNTSSYKEDII